MSFEKDPTNLGKPEEVNREAIEKFYQFKILLRTAKDSAVIADLCKNAGIPMESDENMQNSALFRKKHLNVIWHFISPRHLRKQNRREKSNVMLNG